MIFFLYGPDAYRRSRKEKFLVAEYRKKHSALSVDFFDVAEGATWDDVRGAVKNRSLFDDKKLAVMNVRDGAVFVKEEIKWLKALAANPDETVFITADCAPLKPFAFLLAAPVHAQEFGELSGKALQTFVEAEATQRGLKIRGQGLARLPPGERPGKWGAMSGRHRPARPR